MLVLQTAMANPFQLDRSSPSPLQSGAMTYVHRQSALSRVLAFTGRSIDDVINDPIARNQVWGYFKLQKQITRSGEITELERQWNSVGNGVGL